MKVFYCEICDKTIDHKSKNRHNKTKRHYFMENYVEQVLHENIFSHNNKFNELKIYLSCKINDDVEIKVYKDENDLCVVLDTLLGVDTLYVHVASEKICNIIRKNVSSRCDVNFTPDMKIKNVTKKIVSRCGNMTYRYYLQQPRQMIETKMVKHVKNMSENENFFN